MSQETRQDVMFRYTSLREILKKRIASSSSVIASRTNTDIVENCFHSRDRKNMVTVRIRPIYNIRKG